MQILSKPEAIALTTPCHSVWVDAHLHAWDLWQDRLLNDPEFFKVFTSGDRYLMLHRHICEYAARHLETQVHHAPSLDFFAQVFDGNAIVRFKHVDENLKPRNYPTDQQQHLDHQEFTERVEEQLALDGFSSPMTILIVGYKLTPAEDAMSHISVICRTPELRYWYSVYNAEEGFGDGGIDVQPFPGIEPPGPRVTSRRRVAQADDAAK